ncbi:heterokaryon incompatibility protein-domain-containing protein, partial [Leptodontidium sp. MPI-SDFR-AT-0119]
NALESSWPQIQEWLSECQNHSYCQRSSDTLPTRLISISQKPWEKNPSVRLRNSDDILPGSTYTTLSHCWGPNPDMFGIVTTNSNIHQMMSSIPWDQLSKIFQDAIRITLKLDIMYLWIDSLCIIQGSQKDWAKEAGQMESVYRNSYSNIAATGASNGSTGCFFERSAFLSTSEEVTFSVSRGDEPFPRFPRVNVLVAGMVERFKCEPLNQRGWVIQERLLSPRVLHFARDQMVWECNYMEGFEGGPRMHGRIQFKSKDWTNRSSNFDNDPSSGPRNRKWWDIVESYTAASLTEPTDRLVAILGVSAALNTYMKQYYCWGIWEGSMHRDLLWSRALDTQNSAMSRPNKSIASSWSWASIDGGTVVEANRGRSRCGLFLDLLHNNCPPD